MSAVSILIICGFIYLLFVTWMFGKKGAGKERFEHHDTPQPEAGGSINSNPVESDKSKPDIQLVPKSDFNMEEFKKAITESMQTAMIHVLESVVGGEVTPDQVEFKDKDDNSEYTPAETGTEPDPSIDDVEPAAPSPPASGNSLEEIENALKVAANADKATADEKATAGNVLSGMSDVVFIGKIMASNERINEGIMACVAESLRNRPGSKKKGSPAPKKKTKPIDVGGTLRDIDMIKRKNDEED